MQLLDNLIVPQPLARAAHRQSGTVQVMTFDIVLFNPTPVTIETHLAWEEAAFHAARYARQDRMVFLTRSGTKSLCAQVCPDGSVQRLAG